jgi:hypothetical protein
MAVERLGMQHLTLRERLTSFELRNIAAACVASTINHLERSVPPANTQDPVADLSKELSNFAITTLANATADSMSQKDLDRTRTLAALPTRLGGVGLGNLSQEYVDYKYCASLQSTAKRVLDATGQADPTHIKGLAVAQHAVEALKELAGPERTKEVLDKNPNHPQRALVQLASLLAADGVHASLKAHPHVANFFKNCAHASARAIMSPQASCLADEQPMSQEDAALFFRLRLAIPWAPKDEKCHDCHDGTLDRFGHHALSCNGTRGHAAPTTHLKGLRTLRHDAAVWALVNAINRFSTHTAHGENGRLRSLPADRYMTRRPRGSPHYADFVVRLAQDYALQRGDIPKDYYSNYSQRQRALQQAPPQPGGVPPLRPSSIVCDAVVASDGGHGKLPFGSTTAAFRAKVNGFVNDYYGVNPATFMPIAISASGLVHPLSEGFITALFSSAQHGSAHADSLALRKALGAVGRAVQRGNANLFRSYFNNRMYFLRNQAPAPAGGAQAGAAGAAQAVEEEG